MTKKERLVFLSIFISVLGFSLFSVFNPLENNTGRSSLIVASEYISKAPISREYINEYDFEEENYYEFRSNESRLVKMLSVTLGLSVNDVVENLDGGIKPSEMLASESILLSDLQDEFDFDIVGERGFVRFNS